MASRPPFPGTSSSQPSLNEPDLVLLPWWRRFDFRIAAIFGGAALIIVITSGLFAYRSIVDAKLDSFESRLQSLALSLSSTINAEDIAHASPDPTILTPAVQTLRDHLIQIVKNEPDIDSIYILLPTDKPGHLRFLIDASKASRVAKKFELYDATGLPFMLQGFDHVSVEDRVYGDDFGQTQSSYAPLRLKDGTVVGIVGVDVLAVRLDETRWKVIEFCVVVFGIAAIAIFVLAAFVRKQLHQPLARVLQAASDIADGRPHHQIHTRRHDEFGLLADCFDTMAQHLSDRERLRETFGLYVSRDLADSLIKGGKLPELGGTECVATVLFCDLSNYTRISESLGAPEVISLINEYLAAMSEIVEAHQDCLLDFTGDGIIGGVRHAPAAAQPRPRSPPVRHKNAPAAHPIERRMGGQRPRLPVAAPRHRPARDAHRHPHRPAGGRQHRLRLSHEILRDGRHRERRRPLGDDEQRFHDEHPGERPG